jgi:hypothetical protein
MINGHHNNNGNHGVDLVAYIYGELDETARNAFESHLASCDECAIELAATSDARLGVVEWRRADFEHLATPEIVIPMGRPATSAISEPRKARLFAGLVESLSSFPLFARAGVGFAVAALIVGMIYFVSFRTVSNEHVAGFQEKAVESPTVSNNVPKQLDVPKETIIAKTDKPAMTTPRKNLVETRVSHQPVAANVAVARNTRNHGIKPSNSQLAVKKAPRLNNFEEDEDRSLRLVDLFAEVGPGRK